MNNFVHSIKANLPANQSDYATGNGEGCFFLVDDEAKKAYDTDEEGTVYEGILDNDSAYYPSLYHGMRMPLEMRGEFRPVVPLSFLQEL